MKKGGAVVHDQSPSVATDVLASMGEREAVLRTVLRAARDFGDAHDQMSLSLRGDMDMNATDLAALRALIIAENAGAVITSADLARRLDISTASTTKLIDRLEKSGHMLRGPHPTDRRSRSLILTPLAKSEFWRLFGERLRVMSGAIDGFSADELAVAARVLDALSDALDPNHRIGTTFPGA